jgi:peptidyl-prolyl cis-trans isomerase B (cyclophilin B)
VDVSYTAFGKKEAQYLIPNEFQLNPQVVPLDSHPGVVCMGGYGEAGLASCEFFFPLRDCPDHKGTYPVFGRVLEGMEEIWRLEKVETVPVDFPIEGVEVNEPVEPQIIERVELELYGETYPEPVKVENPDLPVCWTGEW